MRYARVQGLGVCRRSRGAQGHGFISLDGMTRLLGPAARDAFAIFEDLCRLGNVECPQFLQL